MLLPLLLNNLLEDGSVHGLTPVNVQSTSEVSIPALGQVHALTAVNVESDSEVSRPALGGDFVIEQPSGGWSTFLNTYEHQLAKRRAELRRRQELEEETEQIQDSLDRQIGQLLRVQEAKDAKRQDLERVTALARANADIEAARQYSERVATALQAVIEKGNRASVERLEKELKRAREEEEFLTLAILLSLE